jgi:hypothetical protein
MGCPEDHGQSEKFDDCRFEGLTVGIGLKHRSKWG